MIRSVDDRRARAELSLELRAKRAEATRVERAAQEDERRRRRTRQTHDREQSRESRRARRAELGRWVVERALRWRTVAPIALVTSFAMYGQIGYGYAHYSPAGTPAAGRLLVAVGAAVAVESIALYVQWHAHDALLRKATATAARLRRASYLVALAVAGVNYAHFAAGGWSPTPGAVVFAIFSASGPWLWGLHTRREQSVQLLREGRVDVTGAVFSAERFRAFPIRTVMARRLSIDLGITDPQQAWEAHRVARELRIARRAGEQVPAAATVDEPAAELEPAAVPETGDVQETARRLIRDEGKGRVDLQRELGVSEYKARQLVRAHSVNGHEVTS